MASPAIATTPAQGPPPLTALPLHGRVAIVTGASRGIGRAIAVHLASLGANLVLGYSTSSTLADQLAAELNPSSSPTHLPRAITARANVADPDDVKALFDRAEEGFGTKAHILVNSAGVLDPNYPTVANTSVEDFASTFDVNAKGAFLCCREAANRLVKGGGGRIVMISSSMVGGLKPGFGAYAASKAAVETMVRILAKELRGTGITANCVAPGPVATDMFFAGKSEEAIRRTVDECPLGRLGETKDVAPVVGFLATDAGEWVNGQVIRVNGGYV